MLHGIGSEKFGLGDVVIEATKRTVASRSAQGGPTHQGDAAGGCG
jgi:hypothetical protein